MCAIVTYCMGKYFIALVSVRIVNEKERERRKIRRENRAAEGDGVWGGGIFLPSGGGGCAPSQKFF